MFVHLQQTFVHSHLSLGGKNIFSWIIYLEQLQLLHLNWLKFFLLPRVDVILLPNMLTRRKLSNWWSMNITRYVFRLTHTIVGRPVFVRSHFTGLILPSIYAYVKHQLLIINCGLDIVELSMNQLRLVREWDRSGDCIMLAVLARPGGTLPLATHYQWDQWPRKWRRSKPGIVTANHWRQPRNTRHPPNPSASTNNSLDFLGFLLNIIDTFMWRCCVEAILI